MIDIQSETTLPIREVPAWCESQIGQRVHLSTVHRWRQRGARGVRLETLLIGGNRYTSVEALQRFFVASTNAADGNIAANPEIPLIASRSHKQAERYLESEGF